MSFLLGNGWVSLVDEKKKTAGKAGIALCFPTETTKKDTCGPKQKGRTASPRDPPALRAPAALVSFFAHAPKAFFNGRKRGMRAPGG